MFRSGSASSNNSASGGDYSGDPPVAEIVATTTAAVPVSSTSNNTKNNSKVNNEESSQQQQEQRKTHIEVCIRIRPLLQGSVRESSNGFLLASSSASSSGNNNSNNNSNTPGSSSSIRRSSISRLGLFRPGSSSSRNSKEESQQQAQPSQALPEHQQQYAWKVDDCQTTVRQTMDCVAGRTHQYTLDRVYGPQSSTQDLYQHSVKDLVLAAMDGYHTSVLAYGQTSTGKTHTITGCSIQQPGILPMAINECFAYLQNNPNAMGREYLMRVSYLEVYKENIRDLLAISTPGNATPTPIRLFESPDNGLIIKGLREQVVTNAAQVFSLLRQGEARRQVGATHLNQHSSRSHTIVRIWIESRASSSSSSGITSNNNINTSSDTAATAPTAASSSSSSSLSGAGAVGAVRISSLSIVDLAGSESVRLSKDASRQKEGHYINQSLMALGKVVYALSETAAATTTQNPTLSKLFGSNNINNSKMQQHIPYRDSKLTRLLQPSLSGNAQVVLICCISPLQDHVEESHNTFKFAVRAKKIPQRATIDEVDGDADGKASATLLQSYRQEIEDLKQQLKEAREQQSSLLLEQSLFSSSTLPAAAIMEETEDEVHELVHAIQAMERLILKSKPSTIGNGGSSSNSGISTPLRSSSSSSLSPTDAAARRPEDLLDDDDDDFNHHEDELMALANGGVAASAANQRRPTGIATPMRRSSGIPMSSSSRTTTTTPMQKNNSSGGNNSAADDAQLSRELGRIQALLGSVLKKRKQQQHANNNNNNNNILLHDEAEVRHLRAKLEQQEISTSLRKADSSFLQQQLQEKDDLLQEVSNILEQLEARQVQLEQENSQLKQQLAAAVAAAEVTTDQQSQQQPQQQQLPANQARMPSAFDI